jgi:uncharacterized protein
MNETISKLYALKAYIKSLGNLAVGFSGGVDSSFLIKVAHDCLGDRAIAVTADSPSLPRRELEEAKNFAKRYGIRHIIVKTDELSSEEYTKNPANRCYFCKRGTFLKIRETAKENGIDCIAEGSNMDDLGDYRPGLRAAAEVGTVSPLREAKLTKSEIRELSKLMELPTWNKPSFACLASRIPYGDVITKEKLEMIDKAEQVLFDLSFSQFRVRCYGDTARIELLCEEMPKIFEEERNEIITKKLRELGFSYITLDLNGFKSGNMNSAIKK